MILFRRIPSFHTRTSPGAFRGTLRFLAPLLFCTLALPAAPRDYHLEHLSINEGVSQNTVFCIWQDRRGFIWFGTEDGLYRYDGYRFTGFTHDWRDPQSVSHNMIYSILEDRQGRLWIGTNGGGLNRFDHQTERFFHFPPAPGDSAGPGANAVACIYQDRSDNLWIGSGDGLHRLDPASGRFQAFRDRSGEPPPLNNRHVRVMLEDRQGDFWIGTNGGGLYCLAKASGRWIHHAHHPADPAGLANNTITSLLETPGGTLWIGTDRGLHRYDPRSGRVLRTEVTALAQDIITAIIAPELPESGEEEALWIGTLDGLKIFIPSRGQVATLQQNITDPRGLKTNNILALFQDRSGIVWIGVENGGINKYDHKKNRFHFVGHRQLGLDDPEEHTIRAILHSRRAGRERLWLGTLGAGLVRYDPANAAGERFIHRPDQPGSLSSNNILSLLEDEQGDLWIGTWGGGLNRLRRGNEQPGSAVFAHYRHDPRDPATPASDVIQAIYQAPGAADAGSGLWIGTDRGLDYFERSNGRFHHFTHDPGDPASLSDNTIQSNCILIDRRRRLWVGTWNGLNRLDPGAAAGDFASGRPAQFIRYLHDPANPNSLSDNRVIALFEDPDSSRQILWVGTHGGGLNRLDISDETSGRVQITRFSENDGLPDDVIYGIVGDGSGNLWLSSNYGISRFDRATRTFSNYDERDGLVMTRFFWGAAQRSRVSGEIFFGGREGFVGFNPRNLERDRYIPPIYLTDFQIFNESMPVGQPGSPLTRSIGSSNEIVLTHNQNVFSFEFAVLDYAIPEKNQYSYRMEGFDNGWIFSGRRNFATYTNLNPGSYVFRVKGSNNDGTWSAEAAEVSLRILPPFWKTWWFLLLGGTVLVGAVVMIVTAYVRQLLAVERLRTKLAADLHDDIGSSLTEIAILSEVIAYQLRDERRELQKNIQRISGTARELVDRMSDIVWLVNPKRDSLYDLILRLKDNYADMLADTDISFRSENLKSLEKVSLSMEHRQHLYLIFKEGINNAITHSGGREILLNARVRGRRLEMELRDDGRGFDPSDRSGGNGLDNMQARARKIGGELLIETRPGSGTVLRFAGDMR